MGSYNIINRKARSGRGNAADKKTEIVAREVILQGRAVAGLQALFPGKKGTLTISIVISDFRIIK